MTVYWQLTVRYKEKQHVSECLFTPAKKFISHSGMPGATELQATNVQARRRLWKKGEAHSLPRARDGTLVFQKCNLITKTERDNDEQIRNKQTNLERISAYPSYYMVFHYVPIQMSVPHRNNEIRAGPCVRPCWTSRLSKRYSNKELYMRGWMLLRMGPGKFFETSFNMEWIVYWKLWINWTILIDR